MIKQNVFYIAKNNGAKYGYINIEKEWKKQNKWYRSNPVNGSFDNKVVETLIMVISISMGAFIGALLGTYAIGMFL